MSESHVRQGDDKASTCFAHLQAVRDNAKKLEDITLAVAGIKDGMHEIELRLARYRERQTNTSAEIQRLSDNIETLTTKVEHNAKDVARMVGVYGIIIAVCTASVVKLL